ncbi:hypothetical protein HZB07_06145 [Candidatus Saganbacteria bacterium]|nr:hypothetical protein [Candidatus Saganbacteria bacterium]
MKIIPALNLLGLLLLGLLLLLAFIWAGLSINRFTRHSWNQRISTYNDFLKSVASRLKAEWSQPPSEQHPIIGQYSAFGKVRKQDNNFEISWSVITCSAGDSGTDSWLQLDIKCLSGQSLVKKPVKKMWFPKPAESPDKINKFISWSAQDEVAAWPRETKQTWLLLASKARRLTIYPDHLEYVPNTEKTSNWIGESFILPTDKNLLIEVWQIALKLGQQLQAISH